VGAPSAEWGAEVVALVLGPAELESRLRAEMTKVSAAAKRPKRYVFVSVAEWPRDARGKVNRASLAGLAARAGGV